MNEKKFFISGKRAMCIALSVLLCGAATACGSKKEDYSDKTILNIGNLDAGLGHKWIEAVAKEFETAYADYQGKDGKVGVHVEITNKLDEYHSASLSQNMPTNGNDLYVIVSDYISPLISAGVLADMTDALEEKVYKEDGSLAEDGETATLSILDRMRPEGKLAFNTSKTEDETYYAMPYYATLNGAIYDADLFNSKKLYFKADGTVGATYEDVLAKNCGAGPDGTLGTYDDGLPATWNDFVVLMSAMTKRGVTPFMWSGQYMYQRSNFFNALWASYEGGDDYALNYSFEGHDEDLNIDVEETTAWKLQKQWGKLAAFAAVEDIMSNSTYYSPDAMDGTTSHTGAELLYISSISTNKPIAMLLESTYWENEANDEGYFDRMQKINSDWGYGKRDFRMMPIPRFENMKTSEGTVIPDQLNDKNTFVCNDMSKNFLCVSKHSKNLDLAYDFLQFIHSREMLVLRTQHTSSWSPFEYYFTDAEKANSTKFVQNLSTIMSDKNTQIIYPVLTSQLRIANETPFLYWAMGVRDAFSEFYNDKSGKITADSLFAGVQNRYSENNSIWTR